MVATPIGNLGDMVPRAVECLQSVDLIAAEDTRRTGQLCQQFDIRTPTRAYHEHNEQQQSVELVKLLAKGKQIALVSDAGMPLVSDPGYRLVNAVRVAGMEVTVIPGACAFVAALAGSGLPSDRFTFLGFPPAKKLARQKWFESVAISMETLIFYESSHRIQDSLADLQLVLGDRQACVAREITKTFETWLCGSLSEVQSRMDADSNQLKGEFVVVVQGAPEANGSEVEIERYMKAMMQELSIKKAAAITSDLLGARKKDCYQVGLKIQDRD